jgi:tagatose-6-phosphate ketose/aldose isomerase
MTIAHCSEGAELDLCIPTWVTRWAGEVLAVAALLDRPEAERLSAGYGHTLREIGQQPQTWLDTAVRASAMADELAELTEGVQLVLTGSGSSQFAGNCLAPALQRSLGATVRVIPSGQLIVDRQGVVPVSQRCLVVSLARSGDSPESCAAVDALLAGEPACRHLVITCNEQGRLARSYRHLDKVRCLLLDPRTCDQSLVMTSSFTNMVIAGLFLGRTGDAAGYRQTVSSLSELAQAQLLQYTQALAEVATRPFRSVFFLGDGCRYGAAMESALKMLEITNGRIDTRAETFLGLRHGPMCGIHPDTLVVAFLSSDRVARAYQLDLLAELRDKGLGLCRVVTGEMVPPGLPGSGDLIVSRPSMPGVDDSSAAVLDAIVGQLLAFFRALHEGFRPDSPSVNGVINRVVGGFRIHDARQAGRP